jgi:hypothetical protein
MATITHYASGPKIGKAFTDFQTTSAAATEGGLFTIVNELDASYKLATSAAGTTLSVTGAVGLLGADVAQLISVPAGTHVLSVYTTVIVPEGATQVAEIGDGVDPNGYFTAADLNAAAALTAVNTGTHSGAAAGVGGVHYAAADTIDLIPTTNTFNVGKVRVTALCFAPHA